MALTFIREDNVPTYLCLSTDIVEQKIEGASLVGKTVLATDTGNWYVIEKDLTLSVYSLPINLSSEITIGAVDQGTAGIDPWLVEASQASGEIFDSNISSVDSSVIVNTQFADGATVDAFSRARVSLPNTTFNSNFIYDLQSLVFEQIVANNGTITHMPLVSSARLLTDVADGSRAVLTSREYFRYVPAKSQLVALTQVFGAATTNVVKRAGYYDGNNGIFFEQNGATDIAVVIRTSTSGSPSDRRVVQADWNIDKMDGTGKSGITLDLTRASILILDFQWLGMGRVRIGFDIDGQILYVHEFLNANVLTVPYMQTGTLPIRWEIVNTGVSAGSTLYATCSAVLSEGGSVETGSYTFAISNPSAISASTSRTPLIAIRPKALYNGKTNRITINLENFSAIAGSNDVLFELVYGSDLTVTGDWTSANDESAVEYHTVITGTTGGYVIENEFSGSSNTVRGTIGSSIRGRLPIVLDFNGANPKTIVLCARSLASTSSCLGSLAWSEFR
jgi:hypothetical protein